MMVDFHSKEFREAEMPFTKLRYHIVFSTKGRIPYITKSVKPVLYDLVRESGRAAGGRVLEIGGVPDHVHVISAIPPDLAVSRFVQRIKSDSSREVKKEIEEISGFAWQIGFGAFTLNPFDMSEVFQYVRNQHEHHTTGTTVQRYEHATPNATNPTEPPPTDPRLSPSPGE